MKNLIFNRAMFFGVCVALVAFLLMAVAITAQQNDDKAEMDEQSSENSFWNRHRERVSISPVQVFGSQTVIPAAGSMLVRERRGVFLSLTTSALTPGTAVTAWIVVFNRPEHCATSPCSVADLSNPLVQSSLLNTGGRVVGADGTATYGAFRAVGDTTGAFTGPGILSTRRAEIHLVTRTHGAAFLNDPMVLAQQLSLFNGGCPPNACANIQTSIHQP